MSKEYKWLTGWYATRLHAVDSGADFDYLTSALCGATVYKEPPHGYAKMKVEGGEIPHCMKCTRAIKRENQ